ncbi:late competence development ComFB family protein [Senegalia massiliensis]|uniref:late competence development ComFB family protein n=1 Tax=Senegalia massiliensis TaxID=1720316 RepID=UPI00103090EA|nr:late competence development ComFB family protein [Senegalia massiliensis]
MILYNFMEAEAKYHLKEVLNKYPNACKCEECKNDILAIALNNLPPKYISRSIGEVSSKLNSQLEGQFPADILRELTKAAEIVTRNPRHK